MGILNYFSWLIRHFEKRIITKTLPYRFPHQLYLDFNCAIHPVAKSHPEITIEQMCDHIIKYLDYLINYVKPTDLIYLAIDGVAPVAKMKQQRLRRFKSIKEAREMAQLKQQFGVTTIPSPEMTKDFNMISPATEFMSILSHKIETFFVSFRSKHPIEIIFSDSSVPSEGEHKILQYIKTQPLEKKCVIYGLDSDLIMLSMSSGRENIALVRETLFLKTGNNIDVLVDQYPQLDYFLIDPLKQILYQILVGHQPIGDHAILHEELVDETNPINFNKKSVIQDYIVMSFLLGNDFVPPIMTMQIKHHGIEKMIQAYRNVLHQFNGSRYLTGARPGSLNQDFLIQLLKILSTTEESELIQQKENHDRYLKMYDYAKDPQTFEEALEQYQKVEHLFQDEIDPGHLGWQDRYYCHYFRLNPEDPCHRRIQIYKLCQEVFRAYQWITRYYLDQCPDWFWSYPHEVTPLLSDLVTFLEQEPDFLDQLQFVQHQPVPPFWQLLMILPPQSAPLVPTPYRWYMTSKWSPLVSYFPCDVELDYDGKRYRYEAHPILPLIDPLSLFKHVGHLDSFLSEEERQRGSIGKIKTWK